MRTDLSGFVRAFVVKPSEHVDEESEHVDACDVSPHSTSSESIVSSATETSSSEDSEVEEHVSSAEEDTDGGGTEMHEQVDVVGAASEHDAEELERIQTEERELQCRLDDLKKRQEEGQVLHQKSKGEARGRRRAERQQAKEERRRSRLDSPPPPPPPPNEPQDSVGVDDDSEMSSPVEYRRHSSVKPSPATNSSSRPRADSTSSAVSPPFAESMILRGSSAGVRIDEALGPVSSSVPSVVQASGSDADVVVDSNWRELTINSSTVTATDDTSRDVSLSAGEWTRNLELAMQRDQLALPAVLASSSDAPPIVVPDYSIHRETFDLNQRLLDQLWASEQLQEEHEIGGGDVESRPIPSASPRPSPSPSPPPPPPPPSLPPMFEALVRRAGVCVAYLLELELICWHRM